MPGMDWDLHAVHGAILESYLNYRKVRVSIEFPDTSPALLASYMVMAHWSKLKMLILVYCHGGCYVLHPVGTCSSPDHLLFHVAESKSVYYTAFGQHVSLVSCSV